MKSSLAAFVAGFVSCYVFCGTVIGLDLKLVVPPTNYVGVAYIAAIWPYWIGVPLLGLPEPWIPDASFTFHDLEETDAPDEE